MTWSTEEAAEAVRAAFDREQVALVDFVVRRYPEETIFVVSVAGENLERAARIGNLLDGDLSEQGFNGFVTVRQARAVGHSRHGLWLVYTTLAPLILFGSCKRGHVPLRDSLH